MLMPSELRKAFSECYKLYLDLAENGKKDSRQRILG